MPKKNGPLNEATIVEKIKRVGTLLVCELNHSVSVAIGSRDFLPDISGVFKISCDSILDFREIFTGSISGVCVINFGTESVSVGCKERGDRVSSHFSK